MRRSSTVGHVPLLATAFVLVAAISLDLASLLTVWLGSEIVSVVAVWAGSAVLGMGLARFDIVDRLLTPRGDQAMQVDMRAEVEFYELGIGKTRGRTWVMLMVSLREHRAVGLADRAISDQLPPETWQEVVDLLIEGVKSRDLAAGFCTAIERCGDLLEAGFPIEAGDANELRDHLIVKE